MRPLWDLDPGECRQDLLGLAAATPVLVAALHRLGAGLSPIDPDPTWTMPPTTSGWSPASGRTRRWPGPWSSI